MEPVLRILCAELGSRMTDTLSVSTDDPLRCAEEESELVFVEAEMEIVRARICTNDGWRKSSGVMSSKRGIKVSLRCRRLKSLQSRVLRNSKALISHAVRFISRMIQFPLQPHF